MDHGYAVFIQILHSHQRSKVWGEYQGKNCSWECLLAKALTGCQGLAGSALQGGGVPSEDFKSVAALIVMMPIYKLTKLNVYVTQ